MQPPPNLLGQVWKHSHEEDTPSGMVFRPATHKFPPARGRTGFELKPDGTAIALGIGPTDAPKQDAGQWSLSDQNELRLHLPATNETNVYKLISAEPDRLVVKRLP
jgi:hypothetical protein